MMTLQGSSVERVQPEIGRSGEAGLQARKTRLQFLEEGPPVPGDVSLQRLPVEADCSEGTGLRITRMESAPLG